MLEHDDEERVRAALAMLLELLAGEAPRRRAVLDSRVRRIEECAEDLATRDLAASVRRAAAARSRAR
jgi:hypothetical protein